MLTHVHFTFFSWLFFMLTFSCSLFSHDLVDIKQVNPRIKVNMRYACKNNVFGRVIYPCSRAYLVHEVADKLSRVQRDLEKEGYGLLVLDAYRPYSMEPIFLNKKIQNKKNLQNSCSLDICDLEDEDGHNRGTSVSVTLLCLSGGMLEMPTEFDESGSKARGDCRTLNAHVYHNKFLLEKAMKRHGFIPSPTEWWHFDYRSWSCYPILDVKFEELVQQRNQQY